VKAVFPPITIGRFPVKFVFLAAFVLPLLAGLGLARWMEEPRSVTGQRQLWPVIGVVAFVVLALAWINRAPLNIYHQATVAAATQNAVLRLVLLGVTGATLLWLLRPAEKPWLAGLCLASLVILDTATHRPWQNPTVQGTAMLPGFWLPGTNAPSHGQGRLFLSREADEALNRRMTANPQQDFITKRIGQWSNLNVIDGIPKVNGSSTLQIREQWLLQKALYDTNTVVPERLLDFLGVSSTSDPTNVLGQVTRPNAMPLVTAGQKPLFVSGTNGLTLVLKPEFDPETTVVLEDVQAAAMSKLNRTKAAVSKLDVSTRSIRFEVASDEPTLAVIAQTWAEGWQATVNGNPVPVIKGNFAFQAVPVPAGQSTVMLVYREKRGLTGFLVSLTSAAGSLAVWLLSGRRKD
jgi:hypothetical protein